MAEQPSTLWRREDEQYQALTEAYFAHIAEEDLAKLSAAARQQRVSAHVETADSRTSTEPAVRVVEVEHRSIVQVVTDDMPYLVDSVTSEVTRCGHAITLVVHPILLAKRSSSGARLKAVQSVPTSGRSLSSGDTQALPTVAAFIEEQDRTQVESWIAVELDRVIDHEAAQSLVTGLNRVLEDVRSSHRDQARMIQEVSRAATEFRQLSGVEDRDESAELLEWMGTGNFLFLGYRQYRAVGEGLEPIPGTGLGVLSDVDGKPRTGYTSELTAEAAGQAADKPLVITKADARSTVRRRTYVDYVAVKTYEYDGTVLNLTGERRFLGLFSQRAYTQSIVTIPLLRSRAKQLLARSGFSPDSHSGTDLMQILETYPRNELMQMDIAEIEDVAWQILQLQERRRIKLFLRRDHYGRFMTALLYMPRDRYNTDTRRRAEEQLLAHIDAESIDFNVRLSDSVLARVFFRIRLKPDAEPMQISVAELEARLGRAVRSWGEGITQEAAERYSTAHAERISARWAEAFPPEYRVVYEVADALHDAAEFETLEAETEAGPRLSFYPPGADDPAHMRLKLYLTDSKTLTDTLPIIDDFGLALLDERAYTISTPDGAVFYLYDLGICYPAEVDPYATTEVFKEAYHQVLTQRVESDEFSRLVLHLQMDVRRITVLRAYAKYMRQLGMPHSYDFLSEALLANPDVTRALVAYFTAKFDPALDSGRNEAVQACRARVVEALETVKTLDADRVLSTFLNLIDATDRTNLYQGHEWLSLKLRPQDIDAAPAPRPAHEIWVYSPVVEGSHLRYERIARGGLRWSDRSEDFRTEVLGLVKAQMAKNAVIVPSGAKGAFFPKRLPDPRADRGAWFEAGRAAYQTFIRGLLDVTDNQQTQEDGTISIVAPECVVRHDGDDAYLVVAADKGTATFSDTANEISAEYGHWLGDAFASGGSVGYDHKAMGITARGAWESVKSHFKTLGHDTQSQDFTVVGIGDMGGDVFGNGMLLSEHIQLVAAFNHLHIFIDPNPDAAVSYQERQRLFTAEKSGWDAYDTDLISEGGGVFSRESRSIEISPQMRERFGIDAEEMTPPELITALLKAPADLLYNGGIGTYVKASHESHEEVGDRANTGIRINGAELQVKVVAEGGNLGLTQAGRIEAAQHGVLLNTDAIDNSAGVDCSDHEVNIKILLDSLVSSGHLEAQDRSQLLEEMTEEVAQLVLRTNEDQNVLLLAERHRLTEWSPSFGRLITWLENNAGLDRELEVLPTDQDMLERLENQVPPLTVPELSVLAAYAKIHLKGAIADSDLPGDPWLGSTLEDYFPEQLSSRFAEQLPRHPLAERIIANELANDVINMAGATFVFRTVEETFASPAQVTRAFIIARELFQLQEFDSALRSLPVDFPTSDWAETYVNMRRLLDRAVRWLVNNGVEGDSLEADIAAYQEHIAPLYRNLRPLLAGQDADRAAARHQEVRELGMDEELAGWYAELFESFSLLDIAALARSHGLDSQTVAEVYFAVYAEFNADELLNHITRLPRKDKWQALARGAQRDELYFALREITESVLTSTSAETTAGRLEEWKQANSSALERSARLAEEIRNREHSMASITVLLRHLRGLIGA
ncbi:NAD-glutamate dehydrogenase [Nesterenkonia alkaliphila]|uniref:NAD-glutamate dehydrogenase n=1 Tax=Nesterenkonia alkaliphila TaxID=1463631 RepID=A0A7K1UK96_9MICC|nr:NAD-glutamate dehydrogenase [Nesterenkonia alkaliphila]MVT26903.1 NAD-glutamate dehydrogenase [Nesterenkonia alkaliphila]GFZ82091.1 NAD-glutamate dehydrogenase [Nesterenkonia alkaliphila]